MYDASRTPTIFIIEVAIAIAQKPWNRCARRRQYHTSQSRHLTQRFEAEISLWSRDF